MSGQGRTGDEGVHPDLIGKLDFEAPMPVHVAHMLKRGNDVAAGVCGDRGNVVYRAESVTCEACRKILVRRGKLAA